LEGGGVGKNNPAIDPRKKKKKKSPHPTRAKKE
jgi:hypothetical protein